MPTQQYREYSLDPYDHLYGKIDSRGYGVCIKCKCRENTPASSKPCEFNTPIWYVGIIEALQEESQNPEHDSILQEVMDDAASAMRHSVDYTHLQMLLHLAQHIRATDPEDVNREILFTWATLIEMEATELHTEANEWLGDNTVWQDDRE